MAPLRARAGVPARLWMLGALAAILALTTPSGMEGAFLRLEAEPTAGWGFTGTERCFMQKANRARKRHGRGPLDWDRQLGYVARRHARSIARRRVLAHDHKLGRRVTRWQRLGQNTGRGSSCDSLFKAFMNSSGHRGNLLGKWRHMGVGVARAGGRLYVQHVFESHRDPGNIYHYP